MFVDKEKCLGCGVCVQYCPVGVIELKGSVAEIDVEECVECFNCYRNEICPVYAITPSPLEWPRSIRRALSDPQTLYSDSSLPSRMPGTGEYGAVQSNPSDLVWVAIEVGRPHLGTRLHDAEKVAMEAAGSGMSFAPESPLAGLMVDRRTGKMKEDVLNERVLTAVLEGTVRHEKLEGFLNSLEKAGQEIATVMSVSVSVPVRENHPLGLDEILRAQKTGVSNIGRIDLGPERAIREMTHTLHRAAPHGPGNQEFLLTGMASSGDALKGTKERLVKLIEICEAHGAVNFGDTQEGNIFSLILKRTLFRRMGDGAVVGALFDRMDSFQTALEKIKEEALGVALQLTGDIGELMEVCKRVGMTPQRITRSLGIKGRKEKLPSEDTLNIVGLCGHGFVPEAMVRGAVEGIRKQTTTLEKEVTKMAKCCLCGCFNPAQARRVLESMI